MATITPAFLLKTEVFYGLFSLLLCKIIYIQNEIYMKKTIFSFPFGSIIKNVIK